MPIGPNGEHLPYPQDFQQAGLPPELAQMLSARAVSDAYGDQTGMDQGQAAPDLTPEDHVRAAIQHAQEALAQMPDDLESGDILKALSALYKVMGGRQKEQEAAMGTSPAMKGLQRAYG